MFAAEKRGEFEAVKVRRREQGAPAQAVQPVQPAQENGEGQVTIGEGVVEGQGGLNGNGERKVDEEEWVRISRDKG